MLRAGDGLPGSNSTCLVSRITGHEPPRRFELIYNPRRHSEMQSFLGPAANCTLDDFCLLPEGLDRVFHKSIF